jgi:hypothetical protein
MAESMADSLRKKWETTRVYIEPKNPVGKIDPSEAAKLLHDMPPRDVRNVLLLRRTVISHSFVGLFLAVSASQALQLHLGTKWMLGMACLLTAAFLHIAWVSARAEQLIKDVRAGGAVRPL